MNASIEFIEHTADIGLKLCADSLDQLLQAAAEGLYRVIGLLRLQEGELEFREFEFIENDRPALLRAFLAELLYYFQIENLALRRLKLSYFSETELRVSCEMLLLDNANTVLLREVKAITYHGLALEFKNSPEGAPYYEARVIFDL